MPREPQSYGSERDWVTGETGQQVHDQKSTTTRVPETEDPYAGGRISPVQLADNVQSAPPDDAIGEDETPVQKVTTLEGGAKRDSYFRKRDYE
jgi:hypothetical protein